MAEGLWYCHCCTAKNDTAKEKCRVCGRPSSYIVSTDRLPLHGHNITAYHASQVANISSDVREVDSLQWTPLHNAAAYGNASLVAELILLNSEVDALTVHGHTALHLAVHAGSEEAARSLINAGADVNIPTGFERSTPLHLACEGDWRGICKLLLENGAQANVQDVMHRTPLHAAAATGRTEVGAMLIKAGASISAADMNGWNSRQIAELNDHRQFQELLVRAEMTTKNEKTVILRELPSAPWHCKLWTEMIETNRRQRLEMSEGTG